MGVPLLLATVVVLALLPSSVRAKAPVAEGTAPPVLFFNSFIVILREGFEAMLIVGAMSAYLLVTENQGRLRTLYLWSTLAILASLGTWVVVQTVLSLREDDRALLEGITSLLAVAVLFYVSYWVVSKIQAEKWRRFIKGRLSGALQRGSSLALGSVAFLAVYREGLETALFYQGMAFSAASSPAPVMLPLGFLAGVVALASLFLLIFKFGVKVPVKHFFIFTGAVLYYLAFTFTGHGLHELQEAGVVGETTLANFPSALGPLPLATLGVYPTVEVLAAQAVILGALVFGLVATLAVRVELGEPREAPRGNG